ncbi:peptidylprolyl isomerase [Candidatus Bathyarchaeota archaeon]|nr:peptidylprolyl isomerase [Candidatus Bathyarchaeota archaeon]
MALKKGDFALINFTSKIKESNEIIETTFEDVAKEAGLHRAENVYEPHFVVVGEGWVPRGLDEALVSLEVGEEKTVEVPPEKGFGQRDPAKMRLIPMRRFKNERVTPVPGARIEVDGRSALVRSVGAGRVQVDFNHPLAGKTLIYNVKLEKTLESSEEKVRAVIHRRIPVPPIERFKVALSQGECTIQIPQEAFLTEGLQLIKRAISTDLQKLMPELVAVTFTETFRRPEAASEVRPAEAASSKGTATTP